ncbi:MAG TPA: DoxX family protein [Acidobacteriaceae bacterium]|nr:DoxX family protein [Acidobacteriaceae bacterium]
MPGVVRSRSRVILYWIATLLIAAEMVTGGTWDLVRTAYVRELMAHLGYPEYMLTILGAWKILGAIAILAPGFPRLKEWAYAGMIFDLTGAAASHLVCHDPGSKVVIPLTLSLIALLSWALRPSSRRLSFTASQDDVRSARPHPSLS